MRYVPTVDLATPPPIMVVTRRIVLEQLASLTDAERRETISIEALASTLDSHERPIEAHLGTLASCDLARFDGDARVRITSTGEEFLALDVDGMAIVDDTTTDGLE